MIGAGIALARFLSRPSGARRILCAVLVAIALGGALVAFVARERRDAGEDMRRDIEIQNSKGVKDAIKRAAPGPRPSNSEFLECLRRGGPGCL